MTTFYQYPEQLAEKWSNAGLSEARSRSVSRNPSARNVLPPQSGLERRSISLKLSNLPKEMTIQQLYKAFSSNGKIESIELYESRPNETKTAGKITFAPPPKIEFWQNKQLYLDAHGYKKPVTIHVEVLQARNEVSEANKEQRCPSIISMRLKSLDFGSLLNKDTMIIGETINSVESGDVSLELNTRKGEAIIYFPFPEKQSDAWVRATDIYESIIEPQKLPISTYSRSQFGRCIDISRLKTFRCIIDEAHAHSLAAVEHIMFALDQYDIAPTRTTLKLERDRKRMWDMLDYYGNDTSSNTLEYLDLTAHYIYLDFAVRYRLEVCVTRGYLGEYAIDGKFLEKLGALNVKKACQILEYVADQEMQLEDPLEIFEDAQITCAPAKRSIPHYCALVLKANLTPTSLKLNLPSVESSNRVMRKYNNLQDRFLRVQFLSETESDRIAKDRFNNHDVWERLLRALYKGIRIGDRTYEFLAFGNSQLREGSVTFFCPTSHVSCDDIRKWLGNFDHIRNIAKFGARIGQCFSTTREVRGVRVPTIRHIEDIEVNGECFSDGVGIISGLLAKLVVDEMKLDVVGDPSAFQFRMGGAKGVLVVWPHEYAKHMEVCIRSSQIKFNTQVKTLEIIKCARTTTATLNRQTIVILEHLGVPSEAFMLLLDKHIRQYEESMTDRVAAIELLTKFVDENQTTVIVAELLKADFQDPFVKNLLKLWRSWSLKLVKEKCRIPIEESAFVLGCIDETGTLQGHSVQMEGSKTKALSSLPQIFLQISDRKYRSKTTIIKGVCIIGRNPSLHAGDIRIVQAVDVPRLRHLKDVVVFPSKGDRPLPSMLSGGDLDGDEYFVIWDRALIPKVWNTPPMHSRPVTPQNLDRDVEVNDLRDFVVKYMKNDFLGLIAVSHLAHADRQGLNSPMCLRLAELHSQAVDYPKTGVPAEWSRERYQPRTWPHFMQRKSRTYHSRSALGKLYDRVADENFDYVPSWEDEFDSRITKGFEFTDEILAVARGMKEQYDVAVRRLLKQFRVATEFELYSGWAMSKPAVGSDYKRQEDLGQQFDTLKQRFREMCIQVAGAAGGGKLEWLVAALYKVTEDEVKTFLAEMEAEAAAEYFIYSSRTMPLISFPWIFHWVLVKIARGHSYKPLETSLAPAIRLAPLVVATPPREVDEDATHHVYAPEVEEPRESHDAPKEDGVIHEEVGLIDLYAEADETKPETTTGCNSPSTVLCTAPISRHLEYRESKVAQLLRLYEDSDED
ncbi:hypothetical protein V2A60_010110 [Cordyceps javanica]